MPVEYTNDDDLQDFFNKLLAKKDMHEFTQIRDNEVKFNTCFCLKTNGKGEEQPSNGEPLSLKKVSELHRLWVGADFIVVVDFPTWNTANNAQREIMAFDTLTAVEAVKVDGAVKVTVVKPVKINPRTIQRYGAHTELLYDLGALLKKGSQKFAEQFGEEQASENSSEIN